MTSTADPRPEAPPEIDGTPWGLKLSHRYASELVGLHAPWPPSTAPSPRWLAVNRPLAEALGLSPDALEGPEGLAIFSGNAKPSGAVPIAQAYAGHQFGQFNPQLGDGRAVLLGELTDRAGRLRDIAFKGSGRTPFSRGGDGKAAIGPVLREYVMGEAMHALGIPTTRALGAVATGEQIYRDRPLPGALLVRVAASHVRVGTFQFYAARNDIDKLRRLADHAIARHDPGLAQRDDRYLALLQSVAQRQAALIAQWMGAGFIHGVMNTDNMTVSGETIDYGPCAFMDRHAPDTVYSSIDRQGRYAYANQPGIARWNLARLAEALLPLVDEDADRAVAQVTEIINAFPDLYEAQWLCVMRAKLGLQAPFKQDYAADSALAKDLLAHFTAHAVDHTQGFRALADAAAPTAEGDTAWLRLWAPQARADAMAWLHRWRGRVAGQAAAPLAVALNAANPLYIPRNHLVEEALDAATEQGDLGPWQRLLDVVKHPFVAQPDAERYALPGSAAQQDGHRTFCGT